MDDREAVNAMNDREAVNAMNDREAVNAMNDREAVNAMNDREAVNAMNDREAVNSSCFVVKTLCMLRRSLCAVLVCPVVVTGAPSPVFCNCRLQWSYGDANS
jgi:hypothetical protein